MDWRDEEEEMAEAVDGWDGTGDVAVGGTAEGMDALLADGYS